MNYRRRFLGLHLGLLLILTLSSGWASADQPLRIGLAASPANDAVRHAAQLAEKQGLNVKVIEFTDWVTPNRALADKDVDVNYLQHVPFLEKREKIQPLEFRGLGAGIYLLAWGLLGQT
jgi:D-methionine transport system substrate-binding protein